MLMQLKKPFNANGLYPLALAYQNLGDIDKAKATYKTIIDECPGYEQITSVKEAYKSL